MGMQKDFAHVTCMPKLVLPRVQESDTDERSTVIYKKKIIDLGGSKYFATGERGG